jgi:hypothetical protein
VATLLPLVRQDDPRKEVFLKFGELNGALSINIPVHITIQCTSDMSSIIWYIYNESLKKERELLEKARKKARERLDRIRDIPDTSNSNNDKKPG